MVFDGNDKSEAEDFEGLRSSVVHVHKILQCRTKAPLHVTY